MKIKDPPASRDSLQLPLNWLQSDSKRQSERNEHGNLVDHPSNLWT